MLLHLSYRWAQAHECLLTRFARDNDKAMFDAHEALHPADRTGGMLFIDARHPGPTGNARLAGQLAPFVWERVSRP